MTFTDRVEAGRRLAARLEHLRGQPVVVLGLPRGGVPVAAEVARALGAPLDLILVRKLGVPFQPELGMGAVGEGGVRILDPEVVRVAGVSPDQVAEVEARQRAELDRMARRFRGGRPPTALAGRTAVVVDDGIATGSTARAACQVARALGAARVVLAVPVAPAGWTSRFAGVADELICLDEPATFYAIGQFYDDFTQVSDEQVLECLAPTALAADGSTDAEVSPIPGVPVTGRLTVPAGAGGVVLFAHGSGSSRFSPRNQAVARLLNHARLGTLLFDLLTDSEAASRALVFDVQLLAGRLTEATRWLRSRQDLSDQPLGYFGASTGAAAALWAASEPHAEVAAVVSRGGRPDLAGERLSLVRAPTLLVVGSLDDVVLELNRRALARLRCEARLTVVEGATHLFEEPGTLERAADAAREWFVGHLAPAGSLR